MKLDDLAAEIAEHPDDDGPRLAWADAVGGERGELVVLQCDLARGGFSLEDTVARRRRERQLLRRNGRAWTPHTIDRAEFHRGFPRTLVIGGRWVSEVPGEATDIVLTGALEAKVVRRALDRLAHPRSIDLQLAGAEDLAPLLRSDKFRDLVGLGVAWPLSEVDLIWLPHHHPKLERLWLHRPIAPSALRRLPERLPHLTTVHVAPGTELPGAHLFELPLVELALPFADTELLERLAERRAGQTLERLVLHVRRDTKLWPLDHLPRLRSLVVDFLDEPSQGPFHDLELPALRELDIWFDRDTYMQLDHHSLAWRWGRRIEKLAVRADPRRLPNVPCELVRAEDEDDVHRPLARRVPRGALVEVTADPPRTHALDEDHHELLELRLDYRAGRFQLKASGATRVVVNHLPLEWRAIDLYDRDEIQVGATRLVYRRSAVDAAAVERSARSREPW